MTTPRLLFPAGVKIGSTYLAHCGDPNVDNDVDDLTLYPSGDALPNFTGSKDWKPAVSVDCQEIANALDLMNTDDYFYYDASGGNVDVYYRGAKSQGMNEDVTDTSKHTVYRLQDNALLVWDSIQVGQDDDGARIALKLITLHNGSNDPIAIPEVAVEAAGTIVAPFTVGPIQVNGSTISGIKSMQWQNNYEIITEASDGDEGPSFVAIRQLRPLVTFETTDLLTVAGYDCDGTAVTALNVYLRMRRPNKINYSDASTEHIKLAAAVGGSPPSGDSCGTLKWTETRGNPGVARCAVHLHLAESATKLLTYTKDTAIT